MYLTRCYFLVRLTLAFPLTTRAPYDTASYFFTPLYQALLDLETGVMLRPSAYLGARVYHCTYILRYLYHRAVYAAYRTHLGLSRYLDT